jgi:NAD(P)-dependent dehydrogenase (short-subunit alcohol dehydrogenase family)
MAEQRIAVVTGASSGIGRTTAIALAKAHVLTFKILLNVS